MLSTRFLTLGLVAALLVWSAPSAMACNDVAAATTCGTNYANEGTPNEDTICGYLQTYYSCLKAACGDIPQSYTDTLDAALSLYGIECDYSGSSRSATLSLLSMAVVFLVAQILK